MTMKIIDYGFDDPINNLEELESLVVSLEYKVYNRLDIYGFFDILEKDRTTIDDFIDLTVKLHICRLRNKGKYEDHHCIMKKRENLIIRLKILKQIVNMQK